MWHLHCVLCGSGLGFVEVGVSDHPPHCPDSRQAEVSGLAGYLGQRVLVGCLLSYPLKFEPCVSRATEHDKLLPVLLL